MILKFMMFKAARQPKSIFLLQNPHLLSDWTQPGMGPPWAVPGMCSCAESMSGWCQLWDLRLSFGILATPSLDLSGWNNEEAGEWRLGWFCSWFWV